MPFPNPILHPAEIVPAMESVAIEPSVFSGHGTSTSKRSQRIRRAFTASA
jgi:hypothetical protein